MDRRLEALSKGLDGLGCEALLVFASSASDPDLAAFLGRSAHLSECLLVVPKGGAPRLAYLTPMEREEAAGTGLDLLTPEDLDIARLSNDFPEPSSFYARAVARAFELCGLQPGRVALAGHGQIGVFYGACAALAAAGWVWVPGGVLLRQVRKWKNDIEVAAIRHASDGVFGAMRTVARLLASASSKDGGDLWLGGERLTVGRLRAEVGRLLAGQGLEQPRGNLIGPAEEGAVPHTSGTPERVIKAGESLVVDLFPRGTLYSDCTRTFCVGMPPEPLARAHAVVLEALEEARLRSQPGVRGWDVQEAVCRVFDGHGYPTSISDPASTRGYVHNLGHGVGYELHEFPSFRKTSGGEGVLREGDVFTLEPGLYDPDARWGVRLEDLVRLGPGGTLENLTPLPYDLDPRAW